MKSAADLLLPSTHPKLGKVISPGAEDEVVAGQTQRTLHLTRPSRNAPQQNIVQFRGGNQVGEFHCVGGGERDKELQLSTASKSSLMPGFVCYLPRQLGLN